MEPSRIISWPRLSKLCRTGVEPYRIYLTCCLVLSANQHPCADEILQYAYNLLRERGENIADESLRRSVLENVAVNREIVNVYEKISKIDE